MPTKQSTRKTDHRTRVGRERSARTERRILEGALRVFAEKGPDAPKMDDFVVAAGVSRGTVYNYFESSEQVLAATSEWTTRDIIHSIETALEGIEDPALRLGVGLRLFFERAQADPVWCRFVARVWIIGGVELPVRDLKEGLRCGVFRAPSALAARDLVLGAVREALSRMGNQVPSSHGAQMTELCLRALRTDSRRIAAVMKHELPSPKTSRP